MDIFTVVVNTSCNKGRPISGNFWSPRNDNAVPINIKQSTKCVLIFSLLNCKTIFKLSTLHKKQMITLITDDEQMNTKYSRLQAVVIAPGSTSGKTLK